MTGDMMTGNILTLNAGSSSIKFALFAPEGPDLLASGQVEAIGGATKVKAKLADGQVALERAWETGEGPANHGAALGEILHWIDEAFPGARIAAVGHRVVHGGPEHSAPVRIDQEVLADLEKLVPLAPLHQPHNLAGIAAASTAFPEATQVACFDTAFHRTQPRLRESFAIPQRFYDAGVRRYGFHGLSYEYIARRLAELEPELAGGKVIVAHLGNGASMAALDAGKSVASTMGFTALDGLVMGTRSGTIDPGVLLYLMQVEGMDADAISALLYSQSGLLGLSGVSNDMRTLEASDKPEAAFAIDCFVDRVARSIGDLAAALGGLDAIVFTGGIGENSSRIRADVLAKLGWLGLAFDQQANAAKAIDIGQPASMVRLLVIPTNEEAMIALHARRIAGLQNPRVEAAE